jgi:hypothetical protein
MLGCHLAGIASGLLVIRGSPLLMALSFAPFR